MRAPKGYPLPMAANDNFKLDPPNARPTTLPPVTDSAAEAVLQDFGLHAEEARAPLHEGVSPPILDDLLKRDGASDHSIPCPARRARKRRINGD